ncbi:MAG TPA: hypothetical protein VLD63_02725 [Anaerolineales bacterium]|nr:hypothetical protein [Anaerolineales bacterium]
MKGDKVMFYLSAALAILGAVGYQFFVKRVPVSIHPLVSIAGMYLAVLTLGILLLAVFPPEGGLIRHIRQLSWIQIALAGSILMIELGFLLMYRYGWKLSTGSLVTGVFIHIILVGLGMMLLGENVSKVNLIGIACSILGVALIGYRS